MNRRLIIWCSIVLGVLLLALLVAVVILIVTLNQQADEQAYRACVERLVKDLSSIPEMVAAAEFCSR